MLAKTTLFVTLLIAAVASGAQVRPFSRRVSSLIRARRQCKRQKPLICNLSAASGSSVSGKILFTPAFGVMNGKPYCAVRIRARVRGLTGRRHGFHIHTYGDISTSDGLSTGGHFTNPEGTDVLHGLPNDAVRHWGDFGNLRNRGGMATYNRVDKVITLPGIAGRGITIHAGQDMGVDEQPSGASGPRVAVCVIGFANPDSLMA